MTFALLALALAASPSPVERYAREVCKIKHKPDESNVEFKEKLAQEARCARKAQDADLDKVLLPLKKKEPEKFRAWMQLQADYNAWADLTCSTHEQLNWIDLDTGMRSSGTAVGTTEMGCQIELRYARGLFARQLAQSHFTELRKQTAAKQAEGTKAREALAKALEGVKRNAAKPAAPQPGEAIEEPVKPEEWRQLQGDLEKIQAGPERLAAAQCALLPDWPNCPAELANSLFSLADPSRYIGGNDVP